MPKLFLAVSVLGLLFTLNAVRPVRGSLTFLVQSFFASWLTGELAVQHLAWQFFAALLFLGAGALQTWHGWLALVLCLVSWAGLWVLHREALRAQLHFVTAVHEVFPDSSTEALEPLAPMPLRSYLFPLWMRDPRVHVDRDLRYAPEAGSRHLLDVRRPLHPVKNAPVLLQIHGGGWCIGDKAQQGLILVNHLAARGWVCVSINYRLSPRAKWPAHLIDVKLAIKWIREHIAEYGGDPNFLVVTGGSAGGHLTAMTALTANDPEYQPGFESVDTSVQAAVPIYGSYDWTNRIHSQKHPGLRWLLELLVIGKRFREHPELFEKASPLSHIHEKAPPFFVLHGSNDNLTPVEDARLFVQELRTHSQAPVAYVELPLAQHAFEVFLSPRAHMSAQAVYRFVTAVHATYSRV